MDMHKYADLPTSDIESYTASSSFELAGKELEFKIDDGSSFSMTFAAFPNKEVYVNGASRGISYHCAKISDQVVYITYRLPESFMAYIFDIEKGLLTRIVTDKKNNSVFSFGAIGELKNLHSFSDDLGGNTIRWTLGKSESSVFLAVYNADGVSLARPYAESAPNVIVTDFRAVKITDSVYLQKALIKIGTEEINVNMVSNFWNVTCIGSIFNASVTKGVSTRLFAGYGRLC